MTPEQTKALEFLIGGTSITKTAEMLGVSRATVHRWLKDETFRETLNAAIAAATDAARDELAALVTGAIDVFRRAMLKGSKVTIAEFRISERILRNAGVLRDGPAPAAMTDTVVLFTPLAPDTFERAPDAVTRVTPDQ